ncbi:ubiquitin carboxyl-terminal hydrolase [Blumeria hordei DH14]|uniref:ubiquitinyl hydrolase 1 n=1 Tax=Blumeria graminis f. sp. hordei (strain DH14) TaxID=546991 RepID=N1J937_BLUG1|nr:ubiquitin carboxyl-terminal hydrolase [Blumeria hordei DH14]
MPGLLSRLKGAKHNLKTQGSSSPTSKKDVESVSDLTPLKKLLLNAGPSLSEDGSDRFYGMENFGNTWLALNYCNSIVQALYHSVPFREHIINHSSRSHEPKNKDNVTVVVRNLKNNSEPSSATHQKEVSTTDTTKKKNVATGSCQSTSMISAHRQDKKSDSSEFKKKLALIAGPVIELIYENSNPDSLEESTFTALKDIFVALVESESRTGVLSPRRFLEIFKRDNELFRTSMHQDAHEFYGLVLNAVISHIELDEQQVMLNTRTVEAGQEKVRNSVLPSAQNGGFSRKGAGWVHEIFEGVLTSEIKCLTCETTTQRDETFLDLSIDLENHSSVTSCLRQFSAEEMLCERNKFHCDNCGGLQEAERRMKIKRLPKILALHLKRFKYTEDMTRLQKLFHRVVYPYHLRMFNTTDDAEDPDRLYELYAVVVHIGGNAYHGHYISVIKTQDRGWLLFDDEMVEPVDKHFVRNFFGDRPGMACAYLLFYQETTIEAVQKEQGDDNVDETSYTTKSLKSTTGNIEKTSIDTSDSIKASISRNAQPEVSRPDNFGNGISLAPDLGSPKTSFLSFPSPTNTHPPQSPSSQVLPIARNNMNQRVLERLKNKAVEKNTKSKDKLLAKEQEFSAVAARNKIIQSNLETESENHEKQRSSPYHRKESSWSMGRKGLAFLGGTKSSDCNKIPETPIQKSEACTNSNINQRCQGSGKTSKISKDRFSLIALGRKRSCLFPP